MALFSGLAVRGQQIGNVQLDAFGSLSARLSYRMASLRGASGLDATPTGKPVLRTVQAPLRRVGLAAFGVRAMNGSSALQAEYRIAIFVFAFLAGSGAITGGPRGIAGGVAGLAGAGAVLGTPQGTGNIAGAAAGLAEFVASAEGRAAITSAMFGNGNVNAIMRGDAAASAILAGLGTLDGTTRGTTLLRAFLDGAGAMGGSVFARANLLALLEGEGDLQGSAQATLVGELTARITGGGGGGADPLQVAAAVWGQYIVEAGMTPEQVMRVLLAFAAGQTEISSSTPGQGEVVFRSRNGARARITATMDGSERTGVVLDPA